MSNIKSTIEKTTKMPKKQINLAGLVVSLANTAQELLFERFVQAKVKIESSRNSKSWIRKNVVFKFIKIYPFLKTWFFRIYEF